jgi:hypothetical protein
MLARIALSALLALVLMPIAARETGMTPLELVPVWTVVATAVWVVARKLKYNPRL